MKYLIFTLCMIGCLHTNAQTPQKKEDCWRTSSAEYVDGQAALFKFIKNNLIYSKDSTWETHRAYVGFTIETDGRLTDIHLKRCPNKAFGEAVLQMMQKMPRWKPALCLATQQPVKSQYVIPVKIFIDEEKR